MTATRQDIERWFDQGVNAGDHFMIVKNDWFDMSDYPVFVKDDEDPRKVAERNNDRTMECYNLRKSKAFQMTERRAHHWDDAPLPGHPTRGAGDHSWNVAPDGTITAS